MFDKTEKEAKTISLEEITLLDVDRCGYSYVIGETSWIISVSALSMIVKNSYVFRHLARVYRELSTRIIGCNQV